MDIPTEYYKNLATSSLITCIYVPAVLCALNFSGNLYNIGKEATYIEYVLAMAEILKFLRCHLTQKSSKKKISVKLVFKTFVTCLMTVGVFYVGAVLFGAPVLSEHYETLFFSILMTILTALPVCLFLEPGCVFNLFSSLTYFEGTQLQEYFLLNIRMTVFGAWLGAIVIPLDWNKPYQDWPIPCCCGALAGYFIANLSAAFSYGNAGHISQKRSKFGL
ncbi:phosphatidylinositol glycan anchor biosynthesis class F [Leptinotarsa decemlineata]|uniref:phosphatidylinositol glycan anchor biosynthesis class F n=1 Tax=Leptinotarsa decemlineata TaxID=7539 RepID=UPI003D30CBA7